MLAAYSDLAKAKLSALVVTTSAAGYVAAAGPVLTSEFALCMMGTALCSSSAAALNQIFEVDKDSRMKRTQTRPLVTGALSIAEAKTAATLWGAGGTALLAMTDPIAAALGFGNILLYSGVYTYLKPRSVINTWVGAVVGAVPPLIGYSAATGGALDAQAILLGTTLYVWQMPHFFALSYMHRIDYARGGFQMLSCVDPDRAAKLIVRYTWYLATLPFISTAAGMTSNMFALEGIVLNAYAMKIARRFCNEQTNSNARKVFLTSLWYLPCWLMLYLLHSKVWDEDEMNDPVVRYLHDTVHAVRNKGRNLCPHEYAAAEKGDEACPVAITRQATQKIAQHSQQEASAT
ncbi:protoheme IX farnesyltransferase [Fistulifera solaris]|uniref:Heme O synthase n=1 Tax=Fistulifera solaris TaxID=1519565 RepID=A0A1Z5JEW8_FISSO|nr:protoheme IX farnesyltransferase [Fistulifera solaris]|eukprot:GAX12554.1 protoheme IX farnesyltransferase [Fistulifera solaris]